MSLNYGLGQNFTSLVPVANGVCIFDGINHNIQRQFPDPPNHANIFYSISLLSSESVILITSHNFKQALPETDDGVLEYFVTTFNDVTGSKKNIKIAEYRPKLAKGTSYSYNVNTRVRVGDHISQNDIDGTSSFMFSIRRKEDNGNSSIGYGGNQMRFVIMSPIGIVL